MALNIAAMQEHPKVVSSFLEGRAIRQAEEVQAMKMNAMQAAEGRETERFGMDKTHFANEQKATEFKFGQEDAKQAIAGADQVIAAGDGAKELVEKQFPEIVSEYEKHARWADADSAHVVKLAEMMKSRAMADAGISDSVSTKEKFDAAHEIELQRVRNEGSLNTVRENKSKDGGGKSYALQRYSVPVGDGMEQEFTFNPGTGERIAVGEPSKAKQVNVAAGKESVKLAAGKQARIDALEEKIYTADSVFVEIDDALDKTGFFTTGLVGGMMKKFDGTEATDLQKIVESIEANLSFQELQKMRDASKTGGALGNVTERELDLLSAAVANLKTAQGSEQMVRHLQKVRYHYERWKAKAQNALRKELGGDGSGNPSSGAPAVGTVKGGYKFKGGNPADKNNWEKQ